MIASISSTGGGPSSKSCALQLRVHVGAAIPRALPTECHADDAELSGVSPCAGARWAQFTPLDRASRERRRPEAAWASVAPGWGKKNPGHGRGDERQRCRGEHDDAEGRHEGLVDEAPH